MSKRYPIEDVVKFKYLLANIKKIELNNDDKGQCIEEIVTIVNKPQISGQSFLEDNYSVSQPPTLNRAATNLAWDSSTENQSNQQWLTNSYWTITPTALLVEADITQEQERSNTTKRSYTGYSNRQISQSENNTNTQLELNSSRN